MVPYTRGHERMRAKAEILADVREAAASGRSEVQLLGQIVNHYQAPDDPACDFPALLEAVHDVAGIERIRFASPHPRHTSDRLIAAVRDLPEGLQAPAPAGAVGLDAACSARCGGATRASNTWIWSRESARLSRTCSYRPI